MRTVLFLITELHYSFSARQLCLLASHLPAANVRVAVLGRETPWVEALRRAGVRVDVLGWGRPIDPRPLFALRRIVQALRPDVIHVWDLPALRTLLLTGGRGSARLVVCRVLAPGALPSRPDRLLLRRADCVLALGQREAARYLSAGVLAHRLVVGAPGIEPTASLNGQLPGPERDHSDDGPETLRLPPEARVLVGIGPFTWHKGFRDAAWALDMLNHVRDVHYLVLVGAAPAGERLARFSEAIGVRDSVRLVGPVAELGPWLRRADVVWVPSWRDDGAGAALEAMAAGRPVVAARVPSLAEIVVDEETGLLVSPEDKAGLARQALRLLRDPVLAARLGEAGCRRARELFSTAQLVQRCRALYE